jgi:epoxyqueuosine reductase
MYENNELKIQLFQKAHELGFCAIGVVAVENGIDEADKENLQAWIAAGCHGEMDWMARRVHERISPQHLWPDVRSVIVVAENYAGEDDCFIALQKRDKGYISVYARGDDYHDVMKKRLKTLASWLLLSGGGDVKVFVDTAPVMEKALAQAAGIGWRGKHTNLVSRDFGSWSFLGVIFSTLPLQGDAKGNAGGKDRCGSCRRCLDICPTKAFSHAYCLDARRCISYLTIESKGLIPVEFRKAMGNRIYGCDDCLAICPWNKFAHRSREICYSQRESLKDKDLYHYATLDDSAFRKLFQKSPIKRIGRVRFVRNVLIAIGNSDVKHFIPLLKKLLQDDSPIVRGSAVWALGQLEEPEKIRFLCQELLPHEPDWDVRQEWSAVV